MNTKIHGHRGARGRRPENTLAAIEYALSGFSPGGVDGVEVDLCVTADDHLVLHHDLRLNPDTTRDAAGKWIAERIPIRDLSLDALRQYDVGRLKPGGEYASKFTCQTPVDGARPPTLDECAELMGRHAGKNTVLNLELKRNPNEPALTPEPDKYAALVLDKLQQLSLPADMFLQSFDWELMESVKKELSKRKWNLKTGFTKKRPYGLADVQEVKNKGGDVFSCNHLGLTEPLVRETHALGLELCAWTVNEKKDMEKLIAWGVDVITTDYPERCCGLVYGEDKR